ncbi:AraC family transcriptional regulator [Clostridium sp. SYSU_GA19001]|uniref:AraC family transcriptional regulator n=1 Tax=Clostridium caldaquaticum TaxID=2940653 RepID=UPI002076F845|nr:AraC family transcriptional regulator [Clostridium caldaquaticum]MCM8709944.1 AraC family transcriptional regulator [Clostridium caldaquaticum]
MFYHENRKYEHGFPVHATVFHNINFLAHWHSEVEVVLICEGNLGVGINSEYRILEKGDIAICTSGDIHYYNSKDMESTIILIVFRPELTGNVINLLNNTRFTYPFINSSTLEQININTSILNDIKTCLSSILNEINTKDNYYQILIKSHLIKLVGLLLRHFPHSMASSSDKISSENSLGIVQKAINYLENNYTQDVTLEDVSVFLGITPFYFSKIFKKTTGLNFKTYLNSLRVEKAYHLLKTTDDPIIDIAYECGFNSIRTFNRVFKANKGITPSSLR